jgi:short-chain fatty acids transporter
MRIVIQVVDRILNRYTPDPFVIAIGLTWIAIACAVGMTESGILDAIRAWGNGLWDLAGFTFQMAFMLVAGFSVATSPPVQRALSRLISRIHTPGQAVLFCTLAALVASYLNWGLGLVVGGIVALETGRRVPAAPFRLLVAASYSGFIVWHGGLSGSIPLAVNTPGDPSLKLMGGATVPVSETMFGVTNLVAVAGLFVVIPLVNLFLLKAIPSGDSAAALPFSKQPDDDANSELQKSNWSMIDRLEQSWPGGAALLLLLALYLFAQFSDGKFSLNLNTLNLILLLLGLLLHGSTRRFSRSIAEAAPKAAPILVQYPLYGGLMGILVGTGLAKEVSDWFVEHSSKETFPLLTFYSAGLLNLFVPSGGGQWQVQAPIVLPAAQELGADLPRTIMAVAWGDAWTNLAQPFWAIPLLAIAGLKIREIIGLCLISLIAGGVVLSLVFWLI